MERKNINWEQLTDEELNKLLESGQFPEFNQSKPQPKKKTGDPKKDLENLTDEEFEKLLAEGKLTEILPQAKVDLDDFTEEELKLIQEDIPLPVSLKKNNSIKEEAERLKNSQAKSFIQNIKSDSFNQVSKKIDLSDNLSYLKSIPITINKKGFVVDPMKTFYFKLGHNPVYTETFWILLPNKNKKHVWYDFETKKFVEVDKKLERWASSISSEIAEEVRQTGWLVVNRHVVGFVLNLESIQDAYKGFLSDTWKKLLKNEFFQKMIENYALHLDNDIEDKHIEIPNTDCDFPLPDWYIPFNDRLFLHQKQEAAWMFRREAEPYIYVKNKLQAMTFLDTGFYYDPKKIDSGFIEPSEENCSRIMIRGAILASEVGSGKTISCIALATIGKEVNIPDDIKEEHKFDKKKKKENQIKSKYTFYEEENEEQRVLREQYDMNLLLENGYKPSLIIVTKNILHQWAQEFNEFAPGLRIHVIEYDKDWKNINSKNLKGNKVQLLNCDVIITHRAIFNQYQSSDHSTHILFRTIFSRVMIDEFHEICQEINKTYAHFAKQLEKVERLFTWGITGTPDNLDYYNNSQTLFSLLKLDKVLNSSIFLKIRSEFVLRNMRQNPQSVKLPKLDCTIRKVQFGMVNNLLYKGKLRYGIDKEEAQKLCSYMLPQWKFKEEIMEEVSSKAIDFINKRLQEEIDEIEALYLKNKDPKLLHKIELIKDEESFYGSVKTLISQDMFECPICITELSTEYLVITDCLHYFCKDCFQAMKKKLTLLQCPVCRAQFGHKEILMECKPKQIKETKLSVLVEEIAKTPREDKIIVFTQFHSLVDELTNMLVMCGVNFLILRGEPSEINISLNQFKKIPELKVLLMSVEQSASGINVTCANHIFFAHPIFGMSFEKAAVTYKQCVGRAYRIGQDKEVNVKLFVTEDTLEEDMIDCYEKYVVHNMK